MTSSSNIAGDLKQRLKLRKVNSRYFSFKWKTESGESGLAKNPAKSRATECATSDSIDEKNSSGFLKSFKKKLSLKNFYKTKRKIIATDSSHDPDEGCSSLEDITAVTQNSKHKAEIEDRMGGAPESTNSTNNSHTIHCSRIDVNELSPPLSCESQESSASDSAISIANRGSEDANDHPGLSSTSTDRLCVNTDTELPDNSSLEASEHPEEPPASSDTSKLAGNDETHEQNPTNECQSSLHQELAKLSKYGWYWGSISGNEADAKLISEPDGAFLLRDSSDHRYLLTLSFKSAGKLLHARVEHSGGMFSLCNQGESGRFSSVPALIDHSMNFSKSAVFCYSRPRYPGYPAFPVRLTKPVSRFSQVRSLQYLCRFVIRQHMRRDNICKLPLPESIKEYVEEGPYY